MTVQFWRRERKLKTARFQKRWGELQKMCSSKENWVAAIQKADKLLDEALRKKRIRGKNMGERLVQAQHLLSDNDGVWFGHKLRAKIEAEPAAKLKEPEVKNALIGIRQALKDLGALPETGKETTHDK